MILEVTRKQLLAMAAIVLFTLIAVAEGNCLKRDASETDRVKNRPLELGGNAKVNPNEGLARLKDQDAEELVRICFGGLLRADLRALTPGFIVGDFYGDGIQDLFVPVRLARSVEMKDRSRPPFNYQEVLDSTSPGRVALDLTVSDLAKVKTWPLLAVVRNVDKARLTRCADVRDKYILLFVMDKGTSVIKVFRARRLPRGTIGDPKEDVPPPRLRGAAVLLLDSHGQGSAVYWDGMRYRWYPYN